MDTSTLARRIRVHSLRMSRDGGASHTGASFSCADILAVLYGQILKIDPQRPRDPSRDRFVLSKGHAAAALYAVLAECGFIPVKQLDSHYANGSPLCGHASHKVPGVEASTGALGHGLSLAAGMAYSARLRAAKHRVVCLLSDGECDEGSTWEAALFAGHHKLDNLTVVVDYNRLQGIGPIAEILELEPFPAKWSSFGWAVQTVDGHDHDALIRALAPFPLESGRPACLIARTVKGKGVSFMEDQVLWHYRVPRGREYDSALAQLEAAAR